MPIAPGTKLGRYEIRSKIGEGGMGDVYLAQDTKLDRKVALKILPAEEIDPNYALAYVGLANAYRSFALSGDMPAEFFPKAKAAASGHPGRPRSAEQFEPSPVTWRANHSSKSYVR